MKQTLNEAPFQPQAQPHFHTSPPPSPLSSCFNHKLRSVPASPLHEAMGRAGRWVSTLWFLAAAPDFLLCFRSSSHLFPAPAWVFHGPQSLQGCPCTSVGPPQPQSPQGTPQHGVPPSKSHCHPCPQQSLLPHAPCYICFSVPSCVSFCAFSCLLPCLLFFLFSHFPMCPLCSPLPQQSHPLLPQLGPWGWGPSDWPRCWGAVGQCQPLQSWRD